MRFIRIILRDRKGATAIEYALVATLISVAAIVAFNNLGNSINTTFNSVGNSVDIS
ncbi:MAG: pilus assembly protein Flp/PilA [Sphingomonadales bacterium]|jgi:pilus assembly protein Flp/PilA|nr:pilus assembly protein Flp/PilA [Sphingomonadales bacterium]